MQVPRRPLTIYEVAPRQGAMLSLESFARMLATPPAASGSVLDRVIGDVKALQGSDTFQDDVSIMEVHFA